jgi:hypothetical protein
MFHGSSQKVDFDGTNPERGRYDVCLTPDRDAAECYATQDGDGVVHKVELDAHVGEMPDIREAVEKTDVGPETESLLDGPYAYLAVDEPEVQEALVEMGVSAVRYEDEDPDNVRHECVRVLEPGHVEVVDTEQVEQ